MTRSACSAALLLLLGAAAVAQPATQATSPAEVADTVQDPADEARAASQQVAPRDPVVFNGGISLEERASAPEEGTKLEFFLAGGSYLSDVHVVVADSAGNEVVDTVTEGPWLILDLPDGQYTVQASLNGNHVQGSQITVDSRSESFGYVFPSEH